MPKTWTPDDVMGITWACQPGCVLMAAAELDLFAALTAGPKTADELAVAIEADLRATTMIADALAAIELLTKTDGRYALADGVAETLTADGPRRVLNLVRHGANCIRRWTQLARVAKQGTPAEWPVSIRGEQADHEAFIQGMNDISASTAPKLIGELDLPAFTHLLDVGGATGTWTIEFLRRRPEATATLFDLPDVIPMARRRLTDEGLIDRVTLVGGDFNTDDLPGGADLAWVCAIIHMLDRPGCRGLYGRVHKALAHGGRILIRDVVMDDDHVGPRRGALFAINMLTANPGGTYSFTEIADDLRAAGFTDVRLLKESEFMDGVVEAIKS